MSAIRLEERGLPRDAVMRMLEETRHGDADWRGWQQAFPQSPRVRLRDYPALSHLGIAGEGPGSLADYQTAGHVDPRLIADVAEWIRERRP